MLVWAGGVVVYDGTAGTLTPAGELVKHQVNATQGARSYSGTAGPQVEVKTPMRHLVTSGRVPVTIDNEVRQKVLAKGIGKLAVGVARGTVQGLVVGTVIDAAFDAAGIECDLTGCRVAVVVENCPGGVCSINATSGPVAPAARYRFLGTWYGTFAAAQSAALAYYAPAGAGGYACGPSFWSTTPCSEPWQGWTPGVEFFTLRKNASEMGNGGSGWSYQLEKQWQCSSGTLAWQSNAYVCQGATSYSCPTGQGWTLSGNQCTRPQCGTGLNRNPANGQCVSPASKTDDEAATLTGPYFSPADAESLVRQVDESGQAAKIEAEPQTVTGPPSVASPESTTQQTTGTAPNQTTSTVTNQTIVNNTYNQSTWTYNVVNQTTTKDAQGNVVDSKQEDVDESVAVTDAAMPDVPKLYDRKYPDGMQGVWNTQKGNLTAGGLAGLQSVFVPNISGGQCPTWTINANIGPHMNFGSGTISPPCWIWDAIKAIVLITALFLARRLIFGG